MCRSSSSRSARISLIMKFNTWAIAIAVLIGTSCSSDSSSSDAIESTTVVSSSTLAATTTSIVTSTTISDTNDAGRDVPSPEASTVAEVLALGRPVVLAHASGEESHPHSSMYGYITSARLGVDVLDFDVWLSSDGVLVVQHDATTGRTADQDLVVSDSTFEQLHALDNAYWFTASCTCTGQPDAAYVWRGVRSGAVPPPDGFTPEDFAIQSFENVLHTFPGWVLNIEIKGKAPDAFAAADELARLLAEYEALDRAVVTSFDDAVVDYFHQIAPSVAMTPGLNMSTEFVLGGVVPPDWAHIMQVPPVYEGLEVFTPAYVAAAKAAGLVTWVWPNGGESYELYRQLLELGADGINAAKPAEALRALRG